MVSQAARTNPSTLGTVRGSRRVGPFLLTETHHAQGLYLPPHEHAPASLNFVLSGAYGECFRSSFEAFPANVLLYKPGGAGHANRFDDTPARCLLVEADSEALADSLGQSAARDPNVRHDPSSRSWRRGRIGYCSLATI